MPAGWPDRSHRSEVYDAAGTAQHHAWCGMHASCWFSQHTTELDLVTSTAVHYRQYTRQANKLCSKIGPVKKTTDRRDCLYAARGCLRWFVQEKGIQYYAANCMLTVAQCPAVNV